MFRCACLLPTSLDPTATDVILTRRSGEKRAAILPVDLAYDDRTIKLCWAPTAVSLPMRLATTAFPHRHEASGFVIDWIGRDYAHLATKRGGPASAAAGKDRRCEQS
jgi:hypothetical protein